MTIPTYIFIFSFFFFQAKNDIKKVLEVFFEAGVILRYANSSFLKLQRHVRGQNRGSSGCLLHLDYCYVSTTCISHVSTCPYMF